MSVEEQFRTLSGLYRSEQARRPDRYLAEHADNNSVRRQVEIFARYRPFLPQSGRMLDWGCNHAPDSCLIAGEFGDRYEIHGCDFRAVDSFATFWRHANLRYRELQHISDLPYADRFFDVVVGSAVLEHTAMDYESLKEIHRVLVDDGVFIVTYLPNRWSWAELVARRLNLDCHQRLYGMGEALQLFRHTGFRPLYYAYHQFTPAHRLHWVSERLGWVNRLGERLWPLKRFCGTLMIVSRKVNEM